MRPRTFFSGHIWHVHMRSATIGFSLFSSIFSMWNPLPTSGKWTWVDPEGGHLSLSSDFVLDQNRTSMNIFQPSKLINVRVDVEMGVLVKRVKWRNDSVWNLLILSYSAALLNDLILMNYCREVLEKVTTLLNSMPKRENWSFIHSKIEDIQMPIFYPVLQPSI